MPTLAQFRDDYYFFTGKLSEISRQLGFAGIALIWLFKGGPEKFVDSFNLPSALYLPAALIIASLFVDLLHYVYQAITWGVMSTHIESKISKDKNKEYLVSPWLNAFSNIFFWGKILLMVVAYAFLIMFLSKAIVFK